MIPTSLKFHWMAPEPTASALAKKITSINKHAWDLLSRLDEDQVIDLIIMIEESIENFSSLLIKPEYGKVSSLDLFKGFYSKMTLYIDDESFDGYNVPDDLDVLQVFAALAASKASYALEFLAGCNITTAHLEKFGSVEAAATALASDAAIEAAETLVVGYAEFKRTHEFFTAEEKEERKDEGRKKGGAGNSKRWQQLREKAYQLYDELVIVDDVPLGHFTAAGLMLPKLLDLAEEIELFKNSKKKEYSLAQETVYRWLNEAMKQSEWKETFAKMRELDAEELDD